MGGSEFLYLKWSMRMVGEGADHDRGMGGCKSIRKERRGGRGGF